jgi:hypothetical protein
MTAPSKTPLRGDPRLTLGLPVSAPPRTVALARLAAAGFLGVAAFHLAVALGAPWGELTQGGGDEGSLATSGRAVAVLSCGLAVLMAGAVPARAGRGPLRRLPVRVRTVLAWFTAVYAGLAVVLNGISQSAAERALWLPVSVVLLVLVTVVLRSTRRRTGGVP